jgi:hypothetical protein
VVAAASVAKADLRVDEWPHPSGVATFWLLRHADTDPADAASFDPGADLGSGANADVLASIVQQDAILYGMKTRRPLPPSVAARLVRAAVEKAKDASGPEKKKPHRARRASAALLVGSNRRALERRGGAFPL